MGEEELHQLIGGCIKQERSSQKMLYKAFYGFSMGICLRYANNRDAGEQSASGAMTVFREIVQPRFFPAVSAGSTLLQSCYKFIKNV